MSESIRVASDSQFTTNLVITSLSRHFDDIQSTRHPQSFFDANLGEDALLLWDVSDVETCIETILEARRRGRNTHKVMLVLRTEDQFDKLHEIVGDVGAILQPSVTADAIARFAIAMTQGMCILPSQHAKRMLRQQWSSPENSEQMDQLTDRERVVLHHLSTGECDKSIAAAMNISDSTVRVHVRSVLKKLGAKNRLQAALHAVGALPIEVPQCDRRAM